MKNQKKLSSAYNENAGFDGHQVVMRIYEPQVSLIAYIALHRVDSKKPAFGATRFASYATENEAVHDVLSLSKIMSYKAAMAGLNCTGGKAVILQPKGVFSRSRLLSAFTRHVHAFHGRFITGADVGLDASDTKLMAKTSTYVVGTSVDPVFWTIEGLLRGLSAVMRELYGTTDFRHRSFAIQGLGKTGMGLLDVIGPKAAVVYVSDINKRMIARACKQWPVVVPVSPDAIHMQNVDVFAPCAMGHVLTGKVIRQLRCKAVAGAANCQLADASAGMMLHTRDIVYAPDYVINAGGLISVVDEYTHGRGSPKRIRTHVSAIEERLMRIFRISKQKNMPISHVADGMARKIIDAYHGLAKR